MRATMRATCDFSARPKPVTWTFTVAGGKADTGSPASAPARRTTPRTWPRTRALRALAAWKKSSTARTSGRRRAMTVARPAWIARRRTGSSRRAEGAKMPISRRRCAAAVRLDGAVAGAQRAGIDAEDDHAAAPTVALRVGRKRRRAGGCGLHLLLGDVEVGPDVLHVVLVLERLHQLQHLTGPSAPSSVMLFSAYLPISASSGSTPAFLMACATASWTVGAV